MANSPEIREKAISLRKQGLSYSEIRSQIPIAKSTLAGWLHSVGLAKHQKQRLTEKKQMGQRRAAAAKRSNRIALTEKIRQTALLEAQKLYQDPLWLAGTILYWAEGSKQKPWRPSEKVTFTNMDLQAMKLFERWILKYTHVPRTDLSYEIYIHETGDVLKAKKYWSMHFKIPIDSLRVYFKKHALNPKRKNTGAEYYGVFKIRVRKSTQLVRRIAGWTEGMIQYLKHK